MNPEERIAALERELKELRATLNEVASIFQHEGGSKRMFDAATLALIETHPNPGALAPALGRHLMQVEAGVVAQALAEEHLQGAQGAQSVLNTALGIAQELPRTRPAEG